MGRCRLGFSDMGAIMKIIQEKWVQLTKRFRFFQGLAFGLLISSFLAYAGVTIKSFTNGTVISSADVNQNFANLKAAVEQVNVKIESHYGSDVDVNCVVYPVDFPVDYVNPALTFADGSSSSFFTIPSDGYYMVFSKFQANLMMNTKMTANGVDIGMLESPAKLMAGDVVAVWFGCNANYGAVGTIDSTKSHFILKKI